MPTDDTQTIFNLLISGGGVLILARLLQGQYEARIKEQATLYREQIDVLKERIASQAVKIDALLAANDQLADAALVSAQTAARAVAPEQG